MTSIVKYDPPVLVTGKKGAKQPAKSSSATEDILNSIIPAKEILQDGQLWLQHVSSTPATRLDVLNLQESLDLKLQQRQARETGICPIREDLYGQCFDEIIREVAINCAERGLLLLRVRDEIRMTLNEYQTLYESSVAFGMRKALMADQRRSELLAKIKLLTAEVSDLERTVDSLQTRSAEMESQEKERFAAEEEKHGAEVAKLKAAAESLKENLDALLAPPSRK